jgi:cob(I)alamin adenosyltransferase
MEKTIQGREISLKKGYIHVYTGPGKGKTTAALGLGLRAAGARFKVHMIQFMKGRRYSELNSVEKLSNFTISQHGRDEFVNKDKPEQIDIDLAQEGFTHAKKLIESGKYDMIILDEINVAVDFNLIDIHELMKVIESKPENLELVLTGRYANPEVQRIANYVTEMLEIKHPYQQGVEARKGVDF